MSRKIGIFLKYMNFFLFYFLLNSVKSTREFKTINITNETISLNIISFPSYYKIRFESDSYIPNYMKIEIKQIISLKKKTILIFYFHTANKIQILLTESIFLIISLEKYLYGLIESKLKMIFISVSKI